MQPIANREVKIKPIANRSSIKEVDRLLREVEDLIQPSYKKWYAKRFYHLTAPVLHRLAAEARHGRNPEALFCFLVKKELARQ